MVCAGSAGRATRRIRAGLGNIDEKLRRIGRDSGRCDPRPGRGALPAKQCRSCKGQSDVEPHESPLHDFTDLLRVKQTLASSLGGHRPASTFYCLQDARLKDLSRQCLRVSPGPTGLFLGTCDLPSARKSNRTSPLIPIAAGVRAAFPPSPQAGTTNSTGQPVRRPRSGWDSPSPYLLMKSSYKLKIT